MENKEEKKYSSRRIMRTMLVMLVYKYELLNERISANKVHVDDELDDLFDYSELRRSKETYDEQMKIISVLESNYEMFKKIICKFIRQDWSWERMNPTLRSILLLACVESWKLDLGIVTNEYVEITKDLIPDDETYKFVNIIIENIWRDYDEFKKQQKENKNN